MILNRNKIPSLRINCDNTYADIHEGLSLMIFSTHHDKHVMTHSHTIRQLTIQTLHDYIIGYVNAIYGQILRFLWCLLCDGDTVGLLSNWWEQTLMIMIGHYGNCQYIHNMVCQGRQSLLNFTSTPNSRPLVTTKTEFAASIPHNT